MKSVIAPGALQLLPLTSTISITRKLFRESFTRGKLSMNVGRQPQLGFFLVSPSPFDLSYTDSDDVDAAASVPSISGLNLGVTHKSCGILFTSGLPKFVVEIGATFKELASRVTLGFEYGLDGLHLVLTMLWSNKASEISAITALTPTTVMLTLELVIGPCHLPLCSLLMGLFPGLLILSKDYLCQLFFRWRMTPWWRCVRQLYHQPRCCWVITLSSDLDAVPVALRKVSTR